MKNPGGFPGGVTASGGTFPGGKMVGLEYGGFNEVYPVVVTNIAIENGSIEIDGLPINCMVIFHSYVK